MPTGMKHCLWFVQLCKIGKQRGHPPRCLSDWEDSQPAPAPALEPLTFSLSPVPSPAPARACSNPHQHLLPWGHSHSFWEKKKGKKRFIICKSTKADGEWLSQAMPLPGRTTMEPSRHPSGPGSLWLPPHLLPVRWEVTPTKAWAASATLGLCPDTCHLNLFLGTSCCQGTLLCGSSERQTSLPIWPARPRLLETPCPSS